MEWHGTLVLDLGALESAVYQGSGVATVNNSSGGAHMSTLRLAGGITGTDVIPVTDPNTTPQVKSIIITETMGTATLTGISGAPPMGNSVLPIAGYTRVCLFVPGCAANISMNNTYNQTRGVGIAGVVTLGGNGSVRISVQGAPWTLATVTGVNQTVKGNWITLSRKGFVHGGASATDSSTAVTSGVIQFIGPSAVKTVGITGNSQDISLFLELNLSAPAARLRRRGPRPARSQPAEEVSEESRSQGPDEAAAPRGAAAFFLPVAAVESREVPLWK
jgi:hypothetical protein